jgi:hypothetical protein
VVMAKDCEIYFHLPEGLPDRTSAGVGGSGQRAIYRPRAGPGLERPNAMCRA